MEDARQGLGRVLVLLAVVAFGCARPESVAPRREALISDQGHDTAGTQGFFFLAPVVPDPPRTFTGVFEPGLDPVVRIDRIDPVTGATIIAVATLTSDTPEKVRRNPRRQFYIVRWRTSFYDLDPAHAYRLRVLVGQKELGAADLRVGRRAADLTGLNRREVVAVRLGDILPVKFRIERAAVDRDGDGVFDWEDNCPTVANPPTAPVVEVVPAKPTPAGCDHERSDCDTQEVDCVKSHAAKQVDSDGDGLGDACECLHVTCAAVDACHDVGHCETATGACTLPPLPDRDADGACDAIDGCPADPAKTAPRVCGCGAAETDSDADGAPDCVDSCPFDATKTSPGACSCGIADTDTDHDGVADCNDACPGDVTKVGAGTCGCGTPDIDTDGDLIADCGDGCPFDPGKVSPAVCGCGTADGDVDGDNVPDCVDACPTDPGKVNPGVCGCLVSDADSDGDGTPDCNDRCPSDAAKTDPGICACGVSDVDRDFDGTADCADLCPDDGAKAAPGVCGCGTTEVDADGDNVPDCVDGCPRDPLKTAAGACGCGVPDLGGDGDGDSDGVPNCRDDCPADPTRTVAPCGAGPAYVDLTWMSVSNIYAQTGPLNILIDGYITRLSDTNFHGGGGNLKNTTVADVPDVAAVTRVLNALGGPAQVNLLLTGHSHFDHSFDTATWSALTSAPIIGSRTTCLQAQAQRIPADRCTVVVGGETIKVTDGVTMRVIRWNHSGDSVTNPEQHDPVELEADSPWLIPDPVTGGLHAGVAEAFPNGGGGRAFLFTIDGVDGPYSWFFQNSASATDIDVPIVVGGVDYGAPIENLKAALADAGLKSVDLWVGSVNAPVARLLPIINPKAFLPVHWDSYVTPFLNGSGPYRDSMRIGPILSSAGVKFLRTSQTMDKWRLSRGGVEPVSNTAVKQALGFK